MQSLLPQTNTAVNVVKLRTRHHVHSNTLANLLANEAGIDDERALLVAVLLDTVEDIATVATSPPTDSPLVWCQEYFDWAKSVVDELRSLHLKLKRILTMLTQIVGNTPRR